MNNALHRAEDWFGFLAAQAQRLQQEAALRYDCSLTADVARRAHWQRESARSYHLARIYLFALLLNSPLHRELGYWRRELAAAEAAAGVAKAIGGGLFWREHTRLRVERARARLAELEEAHARSLTSGTHHGLWEERRR
jgi:hypothetical protein